MTARPTASPGRASALYRRAMDGVAAADGPTDGTAAARAAPPSPRAAGPGPAPARALPGAGAVAVAAVGLALGLAATAVVLARGWDPGAVAVGPWVARPKVGTAAIDPYARAELARSGAVPMASGEGLGFTATTDDTGYRLLRTCSYRLSGPLPPARFWTLTATDAGGLALGDAPGTAAGTPARIAARRSAFTSAGVVRGIDGGFTVELSPEARPGNWLPLSGDGPLVLTLRLYDTPLAGGAAEISAAALPGVARLGCRGPGARPQGALSEGAR